MKIGYIGACLDSSGYAEAARNNIAALHTAGVGLSVVPISFERNKSDLGSLGKLVDKFVVNREDEKIRIIHATPPNYPRLIRGLKYNIGYAAWETDRLPPDWVTWINMLHEVWVPSTYCQKVFKESGVTIPVVHIPHTFDMSPPKEDETGPCVIENKREEDFAFYSIFQWLERKNPAGLLKAYLSEFKAEENVVLVMKTFRVAAGTREDVEAVRKVILEIKRRFYLSSYPRILLINNLLSRKQMQTLHTEGDCYVSTHKSEGFGIPLVEAMLAGNPVIATNYGGSTDFLSPETGYPIDYTVTPVWGMPWDTYKGDQNWAEVNIADARKQMRHVFENREEAKKKAEVGKTWIKKNLSWEAVGNLMKKRLVQIDKEFK